MYTFFLRILNKQFGSQTVNMLFKLTGSVLLKVRYITSHILNFTKILKFQNLQIMKNNIGVISKICTINDSHYFLGQKKYTLGVAFVCVSPYFSTVC